MSQFFLAIDTATDACSVATWLDGEIREQFAPMQREHTARLLPMVHAALAECGRTAAQLDGVVCGAGPGSFAGLRIGIGLAKGLALARDLPVAPVSSLAMLALRAARETGAAHVVPAIDARINEVYLAAYRHSETGLALVLADQVCAPDAAPRLPAGPWRAVGSGWGRYGNALGAAMGGTIDCIDSAALPHAADALQLGVPVLRAGQGISADALVPAYLQDRVALTIQEQARLRR